jgi:uncharacterized protein
VTTRQDVDWLIGEFAANVPGVEHAVAVSGDGLALGYNPGLPRDAAEKLAAAGSGLTSLLVGIAGIVNAGHVQSGIVELDGGFLFVMSTPTGESILVLGRGDCDPAQITYQLALLVDKFGDTLHAAPREATAR